MSAPIDVAAARARTPGCLERIHLNNAGASLMSVGVLGAQTEHLELEARIGGYEAARATHERFDSAYDSIAELLGARRHEIALVDNATVAWNLAFRSIPFESGDRVLTAEAEYAANYISYLKAVEDHGIVVEAVPSDQSGRLDVDALRSMIDDRTRLISITHVPTNGGLVNPAAEVGAVAREAGVPYLLDACQSAGQLDLDVSTIGCDFLAATGRKYLRGPRGTGFLYVSEAMLDRFDAPMLDLHGATWTGRDQYRQRADARRYETWEFNHAAVLGLGVAVDEALQIGTAAIETYVSDLAAAMRTRLAGSGLEVHDLGPRPCGIVTTHLEGHTAEHVQAMLFDQGINVSVSGPAATLLDAQRRDLPDLLRLSVHYYNTLDEVNEAVDALTALAG